MAVSRTSPRRIIRKGPADASPTDAERLTGDILQHLDAANRFNVERRAEVGRLLIELRQALPYGAFRAHLRDHLPFTGSTAERAMNLHRFRLNAPELFDGVARAGLTKAHILITLPAADLESLLASTHVIPSSGANKSLLAMTFAEMMEILTEPHDTQMAGGLVRDCRRATRRLAQSLDALAQADPNALDRDDLEDIYDDLVRTLGRFAAAFDFES